VRPSRLAVLALSALGFALALAPAPAAAQDAVPVALGDGTTLRIERRPFRVALLDARGGEQVATVPGLAGPPVRVPGVDGPQPAEPLGPAGGFAAMAFVLGARAGVTYPLPFFTGNRLFGGEAGGLVSLTEVAAVEPLPDGVRLRVTTDAPSAGPATLTVRRRAAGGARLDLEPPAGVPGVVATTFTLASPADEALYGLGARKDAFDQRGRLRNVWTEEQNASDQRFEPVVGADPTGTTGRDYTFPNGAQAAYYVQAALHGSRGWTAWVDQTELSRLDLATSRAAAVRWGVAAPRLTLSLAGGGLERSSRAYTAAVGRAPAPPRYVYEPWIDVINEGEGEAAPNGSGFGGGARVRRELETIVAESRRHRLPVGVLGVEGWHVVPGGAELFARLRREGFRLSAYWNPFTSPGTPAYEEALREGVFVRRADGRPYEFVNNRGGRASVIDFSHPDAAAFWRRQLDRSRALGFEAFMHDFGEFVTEGMVFHNANPPEVEHNAYPVRFHAAARAAVDAQAREDPRFEPFFYVRAGFNGVSRSTSSVFPGDETTDFSEGSGLPSVVPAMLNAALAGTYTFTTDVGGYLDLTTPRTSPELFTRWTQLASLTPVNRIHASTFNETPYPWELGPAALDAYRRYARLKRRLVPLVDAWSRRAAADGTVGPVRPLVLEDPSPRARRVDDEWLLGRDLLAAPVLRGGARSRRVYLPAGGAWQRVTVDAAGFLVPVGGVLRGGTTVEALAPLTDIPLFVRQGARGLPLRERASRTGLPSARRCVSRRVFTIRLRRRGGGRLRAARVRVDGRPARVRRARNGRLVARVDLRGRPRGRFTVTATLVTRSGRRVTERRRYRTCRPRRR